MCANIGDKMLTHSHEHNGLHYQIVDSHLPIDEQEMRAQQIGVVMRSVQEQYYEGTLRLEYIDTDPRPDDTAFYVPRRLRNFNNPNYLWLAVIDPVRQNDPELQHQLGAMVAFAWLARHGTELPMYEVNELNVQLAANRRQGTATTLLASSIGILVAQDAISDETPVKLEVVESNEAAQELYYKYGWRSTGRRELSGEYRVYKQEWLANFGAVQARFREEGSIDLSERLLALNTQ
jgi:hypothetical protein